MLSKSFVEIYGHSMSITGAVHTWLQLQRMPQDSVHAQV